MASWLMACRLDDGVHLEYHWVERAVFSRLGSDWNGCFPLCSCFEVRARVRIPARFPCVPCFLGAGTQSISAANADMWWRGGFVQTLLVCMLLGWSGVEAKVVTGQFRLDGERTEKYLAKFSFGIGRGLIRGRFWVESNYNDPRELSFYYFCDDEWPKVEAALTCRDKVAYARASDALVFEEHEHLEGENTLGRPPNPKQVFRTERNMSMAVRTHYWYFLVADCTLEEYYHEVPLIHYNFEIFNEPGDQHLPADEIGMATLHTLAIVVLASACILFVKLSFDRMRETAVIHVAVLMLGGAMVLSLCSSLFELWHLRAYASDGIGSALCDTLSALCESLCDFIVSFLLLSLACGWTLSSSLPMDMSSFGFAKKRGTNVDLITSYLRNPKTLVTQYSVPLAVLVSLFTFHVVLVVWGRRYGEEFDTFHDFEHLPGKVLMFVRLFLGVFFWFAASATLTAQGNVGEMASFLFVFRILGSVWFFAMPVFVALAPLWAHYLRHWFITGGTLCLQTVALAVFNFLFVGSKSSLYYRRSTAGNQGITLANVQDTSTRRSDGGHAPFQDTSSSSKIQSGIQNVVKTFKKTRLHAD